MNMDDEQMTQLVFQGWDSYSITLFLNAFQASTIWEFALMCSCLVGAVVIYHAIRYLIYLIEDGMESNSEKVPRNAYTTIRDRNDDVPPKQREEEESKILDTSLDYVDNDKSIFRYFSLRMLHAVLSGLNYGLSLLLMLAAMTMNPYIFISLVAGYALGDFLFYVRIRKIAIMDCH